MDMRGMRDLGPGDMTGRAYVRSLEEKENLEATRQETINRVREHDRVTKVVIPGGGTFLVPNEVVLLLTGQLK